MFYEEHFFWRYQEELKAYEAEVEMETLLEPTEEEMQLNEDILSWVHAYREKVRSQHSEEKVQAFYKNARAAYALAKSKHYDITISDANDITGELQFKTDHLLFIKGMEREEKKTFLQLISEADVFFVEPDDEFLQLHFQFNLCNTALE